MDRFKGFNRLISKRRQAPTGFPDGLERANSAFTEQRPATYSQPNLALNLIGP